MAALLRETRPGKFLKAMQDVQKYPPPVRRMPTQDLVASSPGSSAPDPAVQTFLAAFSGNVHAGGAGGPQQQQQQQQVEAEAVSAMVCRTAQLLRTRDHRVGEALQLMQAVEEAERARVARAGGGAGHHFKALQRTWFAARLEAKVGRR